MRGFVWLRQLGFAKGSPEKRQPGCGQWLKGPARCARESRSGIGGRSAQKCLVLGEATFHGGAELLLNLRVILKED
jgi:hypothetical protein